MPAARDDELRRRVFLFLQGPASPLFLELGRGLMAMGYGVRRINLCLGDRLFWPLRDAWDYRSSLEDWGPAIGRYLQANEITDIVLFGDCRPYHRRAILVARQCGTRVHVLEDGYLRPDWITLEEGGVNGHSTLPRSAARILALARNIPDAEKTQPVIANFRMRMAWDVAYNLASLAGRAYFFRFIRHRPLHPLVEYAFWIRKLLGQGRESRLADKAISALHASRTRYWLFPLQLDSDYQLREHSPFASMRDALDDVMKSFEQNAPESGCLVVKAHPLDSGVVDFRAITTSIARRYGIVDRVAYVNGGDLAGLIAQCEGVVLVNSTTGLAVLAQGKPLKALGNAIYDVPGLSYSGPLDRFWTEASAPDPELGAAFRKLVENRTQVNGGCYSRSGIAIALPLLLERLTAGTVEAASQ